MGKKAAGTKRLPPRGKKGGKDVTIDDIERDEVDEFHHNKDRLALEDWSDGDVEDDEEVVPFMDDGSEEDDDEEVEEDAEDEEDEETQKLIEHLNRKSGKKVGLGIDDDEEEVDEERIKEIKKIAQNEGWGKNKRQFYLSEYQTGEENEDGLLEEETEAIRLQQVRAKRLAATVDTLLDGDAEEDEVSDEEHQQQQKKTLPDEVLEAAAPEMTPLLLDLNSAVKELREGVIPLLETVKSSNLGTDKGISFLEVKYHLLLNYIINVAFYLLLKVEGISPADHPVVTTLVRLRVLIERLKPIDKRLKHQLDRLQNIAIAAQQGKLDELKDNAEDPLRYKPDPTSLEGKETVDKKGVYKAPKVAPVLYEDERERENRKQQKLKEKAKKSKLLQIIEGEVAETPDVVDISGLGLSEGSKAARRKVHVHGLGEEEEEEVRQYEEENFLRLAKKKEKKREVQLRSDLITSIDIDDIQDYASLAKLGVEEKGTGKKQRMLATIINNIETKKQKMRSGDSDLPYSTIAEDGTAIVKKSKFSAADYISALQEDSAPTESQNNKRKTKKESEYVEDENEDEFYNYVKSEKRKRQEEKKKKKSEKKVKIYAPEEEAEGPRKINYEMEKNKGLTPYRKKEDKTPRTRLKGKFNKAIKKHKQAVKQVRPLSGAYEGELSGIRTRVTHSTKF